MTYLITFLEGLITFVSPCLLPMLPIYISYLAGEEAAGSKSGNIHTIRNALGFILGFTITFLTLGAFAGSIGMMLTEYKHMINLFCGAIIIVLGLSFFGLIRLSFLKGMDGNRFLSDQMGFFSSVLFGLAFSVGWTPCVGAFLGSALLLASSQGSALHGMLLLLCYCAGLAIPFFLSALLVHQFNSAVGWISRHYKLINRFSGIFLVLIGIFMMAGAMDRWMALFL